MAEEVKMPQMGESIAEGTIVRWLKQVGETVKRDEPLYEISTDKVDAEIPAPSSGTLSEILVKEGQTVPVNTVVAIINGGGAKPAEAAKQETAQPQAATPSDQAPPQQDAPQSEAAPAEPAAEQTTAEAVERADSQQV